MIRVEMNLRDVVNQSRYAAGDPIGRGGQFGAWRLPIERTFHREALKAQRKAAEAQRQKSRSNIQAARRKVARLNTKDRGYRAVVTPRSGRLGRTIESKEMVEFSATQRSGVVMTLWPKDKMTRMVPYWRFPEEGVRGQLGRFLSHTDAPSFPRFSSRRAAPGRLGGFIRQPITAQRNLTEAVGDVPANLRGAVESEMRITFPGWSWR